MHRCACSGWPSCRCDRPQQALRRTTLSLCRASIAAASWRGRLRVLRPRARRASRDKRRSRIPAASALWLGRDDGSLRMHCHDAPVAADDVSCNRFRASPRTSPVCARLVLDTCARVTCRRPPAPRIPDLAEKAAGGKTDHLTSPPLAFTAEQRPFAALPASSVAATISFGLPLSTPHSHHLPMGGSIHQLVRRSLGAGRGQTGLSADSSSQTFAAGLRHLLKRHHAALRVEPEMTSPFEAEPGRTAALPPVAMMRSGRPRRALPRGCISGDPVG